MKTRIAMGTVSFLLALALSVWSFCVITDLSERLIEETSKTRQNVLSGENTGIKELCDTWDTKKNYFSYFLKHEDTDTLNQYFEQLRQTYSTDETEETARLLSELEAFLSVTYEGEKFKLQNIF